MGMEPHEGVILTVACITGAVLYCTSGGNQQPAKQPVIPDTAPPSDTDVGITRTTENLSDDFSRENFVHGFERSQHQIDHPEIGGSETGQPPHEGTAAGISKHEQPPGGKSTSEGSKSSTEGSDTGGSHPEKPKTGHHADEGSAARGSNSVPSSSLPQKSENPKPSSKPPHTRDPDKNYVHIRGNYHDHFKSFDKSSYIRLRFLKDFTDYEPQVLIALPENKLLVIKIETEIYAFQLPYNIQWPIQWTMDHNDKTDKDQFVMNLEKEDKSIKWTEIHSFDLKTKQNNIFKQIQEETFKSKFIKTHDVQPDYLLGIFEITEMNGKVYMNTPFCTQLQIQSTETSVKYPIHKKFLVLEDFTSDNKFYSTLEPFIIFALKSFKQHDDYIYKITRSQCSEFIDLRRNMLREFESRIEIYYFIAQSYQFMTSPFIQAIVHLYIYHNEKYQFVILTNDGGFNYILMPQLMALHDRDRRIAGKPGQLDGFTPRYIEMRAEPQSKSDWKFYLGSVIPTFLPNYTDNDYVFHITGEGDFKEAIAEILESKSMGAGSIVLD